MKRLLAILAATLALPAGAAAKELKSAQICGPDGCTQVKDKQALVVAFEEGGPPSSPPNKAAPFYRVRMQIKGDPATETLLVSPALRRSRGFDHTTWFSMPERIHRIWVAATRGVRPFPASKLPDVDPNAPAPVTGGALPPQTYAPALTNPPATSVDDGTSWGLIAALGAGAVALLAAGAALVTRRRRGDGRAPVMS